MKENNKKISMEIVNPNAAGIDIGNAIGNLKGSTPLADFFRRINFRKGRSRLFLQLPENLL